MTRKEQIKSAYRQLGGSVETLKMGPADYLLVSLFTAAFGVFVFFKYVK